MTSSEEQQFLNGLDKKLWISADKLGLNPDEISFYRALIQNESAVRELGDNNLRDLAKYITEQLRKSTTVDWQVRDSVRAKLRNLVRRALRRWKYPPMMPPKRLSYV